MELMASTCALIHVSMHSCEPLDVEFRLLRCRSNHGWYNLKLHATINTIYATKKRKLLLEYRQMSCKERPPDLDYAFQ